jgi:phosphoglycolate phosphatase
MSSPATVSSIRLVVFDLDGTLVDSWQDLADAANALALEHGGRPCPDGDIAGMVGDGAGLLVERVFAASGLGHPPPGALARFLALYDACLLAHTVCYPGVRETLEILKGRVRLAVLTNKPGGATRRVLDGLGLAPFFPSIIAGDGAIARKPDPAGLWQLIGDTGVTADTTLLVGDSKNDLETAQRAGARVCLARYGFGYRPAEMDLRGDEWAIDRPADLLGLLGLA